MQPEIDAVGGGVPGGRPLRRRRENGVDLRPATAARDRSPISDHRCHDRKAVTGGVPGGRPLRRRRERVLIYGRQRLRGTAALQASRDHRCRHRMAIAGRFPGGRPLRRRREMLPIYGRQRLRGTAAKPPAIIVGYQNFGLARAVSLPAVPPLVLSCVYVPSSMRQKCKARIAGTLVCPSSPSRRRQG